MTSFTAAATRFSKAIDALEEAVGPLAKVHAQAQRDAAEIERLTKERDRLLARIAELEEESRTLAGITQDVENRLDGAISEIREALGR